MTVQHSPAGAAPTVLSFWFEEMGKDRWYAKDAAIDRRIRARFGALHDFILASKAVAWRYTPDHLLAAIIMLDQFSRNLHRGSAKAFAADPLALELALLGLDRGWDAKYTVDQRQFLLMPLMHSEQLAVQDRALVEFAKIGDADVLAFAKLHHDQIARFGRFPGRNAALGRRSSEAEERVLAEGAAF